jgi:WD40 repeat protein
MQIFRVAALIVASLGLGLAQPAFRPLEELGVTRFYGHAQGITVAALSPDGTRLASGAEDGSVIVWDATTGAALWAWSERGAKVSALQISRDGKNLVSGGLDGFVRIWTLETGELQKSFDTKRSISDMILSNAGDKLATIGFDGQQTVTDLWNLELGEQIALKLNLDPRAPLEQVIAFSPDAKTVFAAEVDASVSAIAVQDGTVRWKLEPPVKNPDRPIPRPTSNLALSADGQRLAVGTNDGLRLIDPNTGKLERELDATWNAGALEFSLDGLRLASRPRALPFGLQDGSEITIWDAQSGRRQVTVDGDRVLAFGTDDAQLLTLWNNALIRWDARTGQEIGGREVKIGVPLEQKGPSVIYTDGGAIRFENLRSGTSQTFLGHNLQDLAISPDGLTLATVGAEGAVRLLERDSGRETRRLTQPRSIYGVASLYGVAFSPDGTRIAAVSGDNNAYIWNAATGELEQTLSGYKADEGRRNNQDYRRGLSDPGLRGFARCLAWSPDGKTLAVGYEARGIGLWDVQSGAVKTRLLGHTNWVLSLAFRPDGKQLSSAAGDASVRFWDLGRGLGANRPIHTKFVRAIAYSPDGRTLASASGDGSVALWDASKAQATKRLTGHSGPATSLAWSPDGSFVVSGSSDKTLRVWRVNDAQTVQTITGPENTVLGVAIPKDGSGLIAVSRDNTLRVWGHADGSNAFEVKR